MANSKHAFWQALVFTLVVFGIGLVLGYFIEIRQADNLFANVLDSELNILDDQLRQRVIEDYEVECGLARESLFSFADKIYEGALELESSDTDGRLQDLALIHKRYDILRTLLLLESNDLKARCGDDFNTFVYLYEYNTDDFEVASLQGFYSNLLIDVKNLYPDEVILIPIAVDTGVESVNLFAEAKGINKFPVIIVNDDLIIDEVVSLEDLEDVVF